MTIHHKFVSPRSGGKNISEPGRQNNVEINLHISTYRGHCLRMPKNNIFLYAFITL